MKHLIDERQPITSEDIFGVQTDAKQWLADHEDEFSWEGTYNLIARLAAVVDDLWGTDD